MDEVTNFITGGMIDKWFNGLQSSKLTSLYSVLFKLSICNWLPSTNDSKVTSGHAQLLYALGKNLSWNWGDFILNQIISQAGKYWKTILPFPCTIFKVLEAQGFQADKLEALQPSIEKLTVAKNHLYGDQRVIDLPFHAAAQSSKVPAQSSKAPSQISSLKGVEQEIAQLDHLAIMHSTRRHYLMLQLLSSQKGGDHATAKDTLAAEQRRVVAEKQRLDAHYKKMEDQLKEEEEELNEEELDAIIEEVVAGSTHEEGDDQTDDQNAG